MHHSMQRRERETGLTKVMPISLASEAAHSRATDAKKRAHRLPEPRATPARLCTLAKKASRAAMPSSAHSSSAYCAQWPVILCSWPTNGMHEAPYAQ